MSGDTAIRIDSAGTTTSDHVTGTTRKGLDGSTQKAMNVFAIDTIEHAHYQVHQSNFWSVWSKFPIVEPSASVDVMDVISSTRKVHIGMGMACGNTFQIDINEGVTATGSGTTLTAYNNNRSAPTTTSALWFASPTGITLGTTIYSEWVPGGDKQTNIGGTGGGPVRGGAEFVLAKSQKYLFRVTNLSANTQTVGMIFGY